LTRIDDVRLRIETGAAERRNDLPTACWRIRRQDTKKFTDSG
jgi:hypothetical protein